MGFLFRHLIRMIYKMNNFACELAILKFPTTKRHTNNSHGLFGRLLMDVLMYLGGQDKPQHVLSIIRRIYVIIIVCKSHHDGVLNDLQI